MAKKATIDEQRQLVDIADDFDADFYLRNNPGAALPGGDAKLHYLRQGWKEGRAPNSWFDGDIYLSRHADVAAAGVNPLLHYVRFGRDEGRSLSQLSIASSDRPHHSVRKVIEGAISAREAAAHYTVPPALASIEPDALVALIIGASPQGVVLSFSHDNYANNYGGIQRLIGSEVENFVTMGWCYLHLAPARPLPILSDDSDISTFRFVLTIDGKTTGSILAIDLLSVVIRIKQKMIAFDLIVHHFMGHSPEIIRRICSEAQIDTPYIWVHDFYSLCEGYNLLRNGWKFCNAPRLDSIGCRICVHGAGRPAHFDRMRAFFGTLQPVVIAPSEAALKVWRGRGLAYLEAHVVPIAYVVKSDISPTKPPSATLRVAFVGQSSHAKGWTTFRKLVARFQDDNNIAFFHLGTRVEEADADPFIRYIPVRADVTDRDAMTRSLAANRIDIVLMWSAWPESFCYAAHEAVVAGAAIITNSHAGNVPSVVANHAPERSVVLDTEDELFELFGSRNRLEQLCSHSGKQGVLLPFESSAHVTLRRRMVEPTDTHEDVADYLQKKRADG